MSVCSVHVCYVIWGVWYDVCVWYVWFGVYGMGGGVVCVCSVYVGCVCCVCCVCGVVCVICVCMGVCVLCVFGGGVLSVSVEICDLQILYGRRAFGGVSTKNIPRICMKCSIKMHLLSSKMFGRILIIA